MSLSDNYPDIRSVWMNDYANAGVIDPRCVFTRNDSTPSNVHYWSDEDHLSSENLLLQSSGFDTTWSASGIGSPTGSQSAPDGTSTAWLITADTGSVGPRVQQAVSLTAGSSYTLVAHVKAGTATHAYVCLRGDSHNDYAYAILEFASPSSVTTGGVGFTGISGSVTALGSSWYRISVTSTAASVSSPIAFVGITDGTAPSSNGVATYTAAGETLYIWGAQLNTTGATDYNPTTTQIHREYAATLKSVAYSGQPRFEYEPTGDREAKGLLIESSSSNLIARSYELDNAYWSKQNTTVTAAAAVGVTGALNACLITESAEVSPATNVHSVYSSSFGLSSATSCAFSVYCKAAGVNRVQLLSTVGGSSRNVNFNIANGTVISESSATGAVEAVGDGFYRISLTYTAPATTNGRVYLILLNDSDASDYAGNGYNSVIASAFQFEQNALPSSYIATSGSASTRTRDQLSVATADIGFEGGPLTLVADSTTETDTLNPVTFHVYKNGDHQISLNAKSDNNRAAYIEADNSYSILTSPAVGNGVRALRVDTNDIATALNGTIDATDTSQTLPDLTGATMYIGDDSNGGNSIDGHIKRVAIFSEALTDTELQSLTS